VRDHTQPGALPLRPLTTGELLDAAVVLLRTRAGRLIGVGLVAALVEQLILFPLRNAAGVNGDFLPADTQLRSFGVLIMVGFGTEAFCIAVLGGLASTQARRALLGSAAGPRRSTHWGSVVVVGFVAGILCGLSAFAFLLFPLPLQVLGLFLAVLVTLTIWPFCYGLVGLGAPAAMIDEVGPLRALRRSVGLASRNGLRGVWIRCLGYFVWFLIRLSLYLATLALITLLYTPPSDTADIVLMGITFLIVNTLAYPVLGCLDATLHLETRMRTEGLDIALRRSLKRGVATDNALAVPVRQAT
jgi:hypothetical protein